jgi:hypothetical protein
MARILKPLTAIAATAVAMACAPGVGNEAGGGSSAASEGPSAVQPAVLTYAVPVGAVFHAEPLEGKFVVEGRCLYVQTAGFSFLPIFPEGARWDAAAGSLIFGSRRLAPGQRVSLTGTSVAGIQDLGAAFDSRGCDTTRTFRVAP